MTPPDQPEQAPSALSRLERALAGFGDPKSEAPAPEPEAVDEEPDEVEDEIEAELDAEDEQWASPSSSVLDIAAAVAAVESLSATDADAVDEDEDEQPEAADEGDELPELATASASDSDARVFAAAAGTVRRAAGEDQADEEFPHFERADLRARVQEFSDEADEEPEPEEDVEEPLVDEEPEPEHAEQPSWQRNAGDPALPYFLVEENLPVAHDPVTEVEELRETIVRPPKEDTTERKEPASIARTLAEIPVLLIVAALIAFLVKTFLAQAYYIPSGSMLPQLQIDDRVVVSKLAYKVHDPRRGDIVVFDDPRNGASTAKSDEGLLRKVGEGIGIVQPSTDEFIKRVIGLPGETVEGKNGHVYINGQRLIEPYLKDDVVTSDFEKQTVKQGRLWVMGDNRTGSADSRVFGQIKIDTIVGRALVKVWPLDHVSFL